MVSTDVSGKTSMHIDLWSADSGAVKFFLVAANNGGEAGIVLDVIGGQWNSFDIDLAAFEPATSGEIFQLKLDSQSGAIGTKTPLTDFYMDNLYFGDQTPTIGTPPSDPSSAAFLAGAVDPSAAAADVVSLFSDAYATSVMDGGTFRAGWSSAGAVEELTIDNGNVIKKFNDVVYVGIEAATPYDVSAMGSLKINIWRTEDSDLLIKVRDYGSNGVYDSSGDDAEAVLTIPASDMPKDQWVTVDIPMSDLVTAGLATKANIAQLVLDPENDETFYIDDIYWQAPGNTGHSGQDITVTGVAVAAGAAQIELSGVGFDAAFASSFLTNYTGGITYHVDGTTDVPILLADILSVTYSESSSVLRIQLDYTNGHSLTAAAGAGTLGGTGTDADLITFNGVAGIADAADLSVVEAGSGGGQSGAPDFDALLTSIKVVDASNWSLNTPAMEAYGASKGFGTDDGADQNSDGITDYQYDFMRGALDLCTMKAMRLLMLIRTTLWLPLLRVNSNCHFIHKTLLIIRLYSQ